MKEQKIIPSEEQEQRVVIEYLTYNGYLFHHSPNEGKRSAITGARLKAQGMRKGFPDIFIAEPRNGYHGLFIEMKRNSRFSKPTDEQVKWILDLQANAYAACVCHGADSAIQVIKKYMGGNT